jgi:lysozyme
MNYDLMERQLTLHEGEELAAYQDTEGNWTIGSGYNIDDRGWDFLEEVIGRPVSHLEREQVRITREESRKLLRADIRRLEPIIVSLLPEYRDADEVRQRVVLDMGFNMGRRALNFRRALEAFKLKQWSRCARELYRSKWAHQVDDGEGGRFGRADRLAKMILTGQEPSDPDWIRFVLKGGS